MDGSHLHQRISVLFNCYYFFEFQIEMELILNGAHIS